MMHASIHEPFAPVLASWIVEPVSTGREPTVRGIQLDQKPFPADWHHALVSIHATVRRTAENADGLTLICESNDHRFSASLKSAAAFEHPIRKGAIVSLTGICTLGSSDSEAHAYSADQFELTLRHPNDLKLPTPPVLWTTRLEHPDQTRSGRSDPGGSRRCAPRHDPFG